jgi:hypothetical protein
MEVTNERAAGCVDSSSVTGDEWDFVVVLDELSLVKHDESTKCQVENVKEMSKC